MKTRNNIYVPSKIKTLKDLIINHEVIPISKNTISVSGLKCGNWSQPIVQPEDLKKESIKWIKEFKESQKRDMKDGRDFVKKEMVILWIKKFFNITDDDLKKNQEDKHMW